MFGKYNHTVDAKGRLFVPSKLRDELGEVFYVTIGLDDCLSVYPTEKWDTIVQHYNALPLSQAGKIRFFFANVARCEPDKQGRFLIPAELRKYAGLTDEVTFIGQGDHAEIWNAETYSRKEAAFLTPENLTAAMEELGF
ncbi:MAG: division/cell wall cluster transcriptional repressor MraZ [Faecousia sp.]